MKIAGLQPVSLCDYPGRVAAVVFTQGCNFCCGFCHNGGLIPLDAQAESLIPQGQVLDRLAKRAAFLDGLVISGGEPTLQPDLIPFIEQVRKLGLLVKLDTNGSRPEVLKGLIEGCWVDFVAMDVKAPFERYGQVSGVEVSMAAIQASIALIASSGIEHQFRTTAVPALLADRDIEAIRRALPPASPYRVQPFVPELAMDPSLRLAS